jgi:hypothetical protein
LSNVALRGAVNGWGAAAKRALEACAVEERKAAKHDSRGKLVMPKPKRRSGRWCCMWDSIRPREGQAEDVEAAVVSVIGVLFEMRAGDRRWDGEGEVLGSQL